MSHSSALRESIWVDQTESEKIDFKDFYEVMKVKMFEDMPPDEAAKAFKLMSNESGVIDLPHLEVILDLNKA